MAVEVPQRKGQPVRVAKDEYPRAGTTVEKLAALKPAFAKDGTVTAGNASGINDGAAALVVATEEKARSMGRRPLARILSYCTTGVDPLIMGMGPVDAMRKAADRAKVDLRDLDLIELNEAFAAQAIPCVEQIGLDPDRVNVNGGAIALGHPIGASGARIVATLLHELRRREGRYGLATLCLGGGGSVAAGFERVA